VCWWEDDGQDDEDADVVRGGPNGELSLEAARHNYRLAGAADPRWVGNVRFPRPDEKPSRSFESPSELHCFVERVSALLRSEGRHAAADRLQVAGAMGSTGSEWLGEIGHAIRSIERSEVLSSTVQRGFRIILDEIHRVWPEL